MIDLRWKMVVCCGCGKRYRCTPETDYYTPKGFTGERTSSNGVCWACLPGTGGTDEPSYGDTANLP